jgi:hypothetical protein
MHWKTLWKKYHNDRVQWVHNENQPAEGIDTIRFYLSNLELNLASQDEVIDHFRLEAKRNYIHIVGMDTLYQTFADELEHTNLPEVSERLIDDDPYVEIKRALLLESHKHIGPYNDGLIIDFQFLHGDYTDRIRPTHFIISMYPCGTWAAVRDKDERNPKLCNSGSFRSWLRIHTGSELHHYIVNIPQSGMVLMEVEAWKAYRFLLGDEQMSKAESEGCIAR